ncbi:MAG: Mrp/NBP35 family ATP-binding protein [Methanothrix sp.]|nr:Mrp/NBP35 family ATP-binding protein [Methanothrix sp.]
MSRIKNKILVGSGKGGTGKSTIAVNLAVTLRRRGYRVGLLDADITGPDIPRLLGIEDIRLHSGPEGIEPADADGIKVVSMALLLDSRKSAAVWRGPRKAAAIKQFLSDVNWGDLDVFIVDLPPGTSDEPVSLVQLIPDLSGALVVTTPQGVALLDSRKAVTMFQEMGVPVLGLIENMSYLSCPWCGERIEIFKRGNGMAAARELGVDFLGSIPLDPEIGSLAEEGISFVGRGTGAQEAFDAIVSKVLEKLLPAIKMEAT